jgi:cytidylate kinase
MPIVIVSQLSNTGGETIVRNAAERLGYSLAGDEVFDEASRRSGIPADKLRKALFDAPSLFGMSPAARRRSAAYVQAAMATRLLEDGVVFHGPYGHVMIEGISHVIKVRIAAPLEYRAASLAERERCGAKEAEKMLAREDAQRASIADLLFGVDESDPALFNLVIDAAGTDAAAAARLIAETALQERYRPNTYSRKSMADFELTCRIRAALVGLDPDVQVQASQGEVRIRTRTGGRAKEKRIQEIRGIVEAHEGVSKVEIEALTHLADLLDKKRLR